MKNIDKSEKIGKIENKGNERCKDFEKVVNWRKYRYCFEERLFTTAFLEHMWESCPRKQFEEKTFRWQQEC